MSLKVTNHSDSDEDEAMKAEVNNLEKKSLPYAMNTSQFMDYLIDPSKEHLTHNWLVALTWDKSSQEIIEAFTEKLKELNNERKSDSYNKNLAALARNITIEQGTAFKQIKPSEFWRAKWNDSNYEAATSNLNKFIVMTNNFALGVEMDLLNPNPERTNQQRADLISSYIDLAEKLYKEGNVNGTFAIIQVLNSTPIERLTDSWDLVPQEQKLRLKAFLDDQFSMKLEGANIGKEENRLKGRNTLFAKPLSRRCI